MTKNKPFYITQILKECRIDDYLQSKGFHPTSTDASGSKYRCPSPSHNDSTPSFSVLHEDTHDYFKCFGCNIHGDIINLYCILENVSLKQAITHFAKEMNLDHETITESVINDIINKDMDYGTASFMDDVLCVNKACYNFLQSAQWDSKELEIVEQAMELIDNHIVHGADTEKLKKIYGTLKDLMEKRMDQLVDKRELDAIRHNTQ